jgi:hypothetical protein
MQVRPGMMMCCNIPGRSRLHEPGINPDARTFTLAYARVRTKKR